MGDVKVSSPPKYLSSLLLYSCSDTVAIEVGSEYDTKIAKTDGVENWRSQVATLVYPERLQGEVDTVSRHSLFKQGAIGT